MKQLATLTLESLEGDGLRFGARTGRIAFTLDSGPTVSYPSPVETLLASVGACTGMDVIAILRKKRQNVTGYEVEGEGNDEHPRRFTRFSIVHRFRGSDLKPAALEEAIRLSEEKYCSVIATLRGCVEIASRYEVVA